jgi:hypothetical protein
MISPLSAANIHRGVCRFIFAKNHIGAIHFAPHNGLTPPADCAIIS